MYFLKKAAVFLLCALVLTGGMPAAIPLSDSGEQIEQTAARPLTELSDTDVAAPYAVLYEPDSGSVIFQKQADVATAPASVTKIMSLLLIMEAIERGDIALSDEVTCSDTAARMGGSQIWLEPGETMTVDDLLKAVAVGSANDATVALAEHVAGSEAAFAAMMNARAAELGMTGTCYKNASGLDEEGHFTTAADTALAAAELLNHPLIINYSTIWMDTLRGGATELVNTNRLVRFYSGITGLKTGTTDNAGCCLAATAERDGFKLIAVVFGAASSDDRFSAARTLLDYGYANYTVFLPTPPEQLPTVKVKGGVVTEIGVSSGEISGILLPKGGEKGITYAVELQSEISAPVEQGQTLGRVCVTAQDGKYIGEFALIAVSGAEKLTWSVAFLMLLRSVFAMP